MTTQTEKSTARWTMPAVLLTLLVAGWLGGVAFFTSRDDSRSGQQDAKAGSSPGERGSDASDGDVPDDILSPLGGLIGGNLHQGSLNIGMVADAVEGKLYTRDEGHDLLDTVSALIDNTEDQINKLPAETLQPEDRRCLERFRAVLPPLKTQIAELRLFWDTDEEAHAERFQKARSEAQTALDAMLHK